MSWMDVRSAFQEIGVDMRRDYMIRRYQKLIKGQLPVEEKVADTLAHTVSEIVASWRAFVKRILDVTIVSIALVLGAPLFALIALAIKLDSRGPAIYSQERVGMKGKLFRIYKFRSMRTDAELATGPVWAKENDPRVTRLGKFLRTSHLDELPQLFNVLKGDMSIVGPRPERPHFVKQLRKEIPHYDRRHYAKPGITGLAQIKRRYDETLADVRHKVRYDVLYIKRMCPLLDLKVITLTVLAVVFRTGR